MTTNSEEKSIYEFVEELIFSFQKYVKETLKNQDISEKEFILLMNIKKNSLITQKELADKYNLTEGYTAKLLRKFEDNNLIKREENKENRRQKLVSLTEEGQQYTDFLNETINDWEELITSNIEPEEYKQVKQILNKMINQEE